MMITNFITGRSKNLLVVAFVKPFPHVVTSICTNAIAASSDETVQQFSSVKLLGNHHTPVSYSTDSDLVAVLCNIYLMFF